MTNFQHTFEVLFNYSCKINVNRFVSFLQMWADSVIEYDIIVETLTGNEIEVTINRRQTIAFIKFHIQKYEGTCICKL